MGNTSKGIHFTVAREESLMAIHGFPLSFRRQPHAKAYKNYIRALLSQRCKLSPLQCIKIKGEKRHPA